MSERIINPDKTCKGCGSSFNRRIRNGLVVENNYRFQKRDFCSLGCAWKGRKHTEETRHKLRTSHLGKPQPWKQGCKSHFWKGGKTADALIIRASCAYKNWRMTVFERDSYTCQECGRVGGRLNADHIKPFSQFPELRLDVNNGRTLCEPCHILTPTFGGGSRKKICKQ